MSNLLEQAIIDATALREVAMKNAESALIEKYSKEFKESVEKLLEQEGLEADPLATPALETPIPTDTGMALEKPEDEDAFSDVPSSFLDGEDEDMITIDFDQLKKQVSSALGGENPLLSTPSTQQSLETPAAPEAAAPMMENFEIDEDELEEAYDINSQDPAEEALTPGASSEIEEGVDEDKLIPKKKKKKNGDTMPSQANLDEDFVEEEEHEEREALDLDEELFNLEEEEDPAQLEALAQSQEMQAKASENYAKQEANQLRAAAISSRNAAGRVRAAKKPVAENIEISEEELNELMEELKVDINVDNLSDGHMGTTVTQKREQRNMELAAARGDKQEEVRQAELEAMSDLKQKLDEALEVGGSLVEENEDLRAKLAEVEENLLSLKENVEKLSISNAKLLYTNKVLGNISLNERQKEQIVESISKSTSVLEAKTIYNTLQSAVSGISSNKKPKESLSEAINRSNSPFLTRKQQTAEQPFAERMKKLAGIS